MSRPTLPKTKRRQVVALRRWKAQQRQVRRLLGREAAVLFAARSITGKGSES